ncbi:MAG: hypothetical protein AAGE52_27820 [Myxococcota bacterium]
MRAFNATVMVLLASTACDSDSSGVDSGAVDTGAVDTGAVDTGAVDSGSGRECSGPALPGDSFYPEGIALGPDGSLAVASAGTGRVVVLSAGADEFTELVPASEPAIANAIGLRYDETAALYWVCSTDFSGLFDNGMGTLVGVSPEDGSVVVTHSLGTGALCNDIAVSAAHGVFATDSRGSQLWRVPRADVRTGDSAEVWVADERFAEGLAGDGLSLNGVAIDEPANAVYTARIDTGELFRVALEADGSAGAVDEISLAGGDILSADGMTLEASGTLLVIQNASGEVDRVRVTGSEGRIESIATGLDEPATAVLRGDELLITETQFSELFGGTLMPTLPFCLARVPLSE